MELLQRRKFCREFLNGYNEKLHPQIISRVFEIGLLTLKNTFNKLLFSIEELDEIIKSLGGKDYVDVVPLPPRKKLEKLNMRENNSELKKEEDEKKIFLKNQQMHKHYLENPNFATQNNKIYPFWWWNNKEEDFDEMKKDAINNNNINLTDQEIIYDNNEFLNNYDYEENNNNKFNKKDNQRQIVLSEEEYGKLLKEREMKKLNKNQLIPKKEENKTKNQNLNNNKIGNKQRVKSSRINPRNNNSFNNQRYKKLDNYKINKVQNRKNLDLQKIPKFKYLYNNGRIVKMKENQGINTLNLTEPNNNY